jgi:hypothetical protein
MRSAIASLIALCAVAIAIAAAPAQAHWDRHHDGFDPYAYRYEPRGYYPYYNSSQWVPAAWLRWRRACCRPAPVLPPYYAAWGSPKSGYVHRAWHDRHHGRHWHHHW